MQKVEIVAPNKAHIDRLEFNDFIPRPDLDYIGQTSIDLGQKELAAQNQEGEGPDGKGVS